MPETASDASIRVEKGCDCLDIIVQHCFEIGFERKIRLVNDLADAAIEALNHPIFSGRLGEARPCSFSHCQDTTSNTCLPMDIRLPSASLFFW